jgi:hypothetical protein
MQWMPFILAPTSEVKHNGHWQPDDHGGNDPDSNLSKIRTHTTEATKIIEERKYAIVNNDKRRKEAEKCRKKLKAIDACPLEKAWPFGHGFY